MSTAVMTSSIASVPSSSGTKEAAKPDLSLREWLGAFSSALAMANAVPENGRVSVKQTGRVHAMAEAI
jgi:hypothetical protein